MRRGFVLAEDEADLGAALIDMGRSTTLAWCFRAGGLSWRRILRRGASYVTNEWLLHAASIRAWRRGAQQEPTRQCAGRGSDEALLNSVCRR